MSTDSVAHQFDQAASIGDIERLLLLDQSPEIRVCVPIDQKDAFMATIEAYNRSLIAKADPQKILANLRRVAAAHYIRHADGFHEVKRLKPVNPDKQFASFKDFVARCRTDEKFLTNNMTREMCLAVDKNAKDQNAEIARVKAADIAAKSIDAFIEKNGYTDLELIGDGAFTLAFRAVQKTTGRARVFKICAWGDEMPVKGHDTSRNLKRLEEQPENMPEDWFFHAFPEVLPLYDVVEELGPRRSILVAYQDTNAGPDDNQNKVHSCAIIHDSELVTQMVINGLPAGWFASDEQNEMAGLAILPNGQISALDMGLFTPINYPCIRAFSKTLEAARREKFGSLGAPFVHTDLNGVSQDVIFFQPERYPIYRQRALQVTVSKAPDGAQAEVA